MYGLVGSEHSKTKRSAQYHPQQQQQQLQQHQPEEHQSQHHHERRTSRRRRSLFIRFLDFVKEAWTGVKFALDSELDDAESTPRYRPESLESLSRLTRFTESEIKRIYRGFKAECPSGVVQENTFCDIYAQFFPQGANTGHYAHYFFNTFDVKKNGLIIFEDFVRGLSILSRGTLQEKLRWTFSLYDINGDGYITKEEMKDVVTAIFELMGNCTEPMIEEGAVEDRVDRIFLKMDRNLDGMVTLDEFLDCCTHDENITKSMCIFDSVI